MRLVLFCPSDCWVPKLPPPNCDQGMLCALPASSMQQNMQNVTICCHADGISLTTADKQVLNRTCQFMTVFSICVVFVFPFSKLHTEHFKNVATKVRFTLLVPCINDLLKMIFWK